MTVRRWTWFTAKKTMKKNKPKKTIMVGMGPNAVRTYLPFFVQEGITLCCVVEMQAAKTALQQKLLQYGIPAKLILVPDECRDAMALDSEIAAQISRMIDSEKIEYAIINSEPKSHFAYVSFFLGQDVKILLEKPILAPQKLENYSDVEDLRRQYWSICNYVAQNDASCCGVMCQRRMHYGYEYIKQIIKDTITEYGIPITEIYLNHCDGNWMLPQDLFYENHPYQYGYGKLYHSGYHFVDLLAQLLALNKAASEEKWPASASVATSLHTVIDEMAVITGNDLKKIFNTAVLPDMPQGHTDSNFNNFGEKNIYSQFDIKNQKGQTVTVVQASITQMGFSRRAWLKANKDHYKGNGRIRHEYLNIQIGPLMNIRVSSYQSKEICDRMNDEHLSGGLDHFDIEIFRNAGLIGGEPYQKIGYLDLLHNQKTFSLSGLNEISRARMLNMFFYDDIRKVSDIRDHDLGMRLMHTMTEGIVDHKKRKTQIRIIDLKDVFTKQEGV